MKNLQEKLKGQISKLPSTPGVYRFIGAKKNLLYIGKATSLKSRVRSYFALDIGEKRSEWIKKMVGEAVDIKFEKTDSVLEALILEAELIKKYLPLYNSIGKDQRSWNYVVITKEDFPRVLIMREREIIHPPHYRVAPLLLQERGGQRNKSTKNIWRNYFW